MAGGLLDGLQDVSGQSAPTSNQTLLGLLTALGLGGSGGTPVGQGTQPAANYAMGTPDPTQGIQAIDNSNGPGPSGFGGSAPAQTQPDPTQAAQSNVATAAPQNAQIQQQQVPDTPVAQVQAGSPAPDMTNGGASPSPQDSSQATGVLGQLAGQAAQDPNASKGILAQLGTFASNLGTKLTHLSPSQSQALLAAGSQILAANNGTKNLGQLVGEGAAAGVNNYNQSQINQANIIKATSQAGLDRANAQAALINAQTNANAPHVVEPGSSVVTPNQLANGAPPINGGGTKPVGAPIETQDAQGNILQQQMGYVNGQWGAIGQPTLKTQVDVGPLGADQRTTVNAAQDTAQQSALLLNHVQGYLTKLSPTMTDPTSGQQVPNPNYTPIPGGASATVQQAFASLTGSPAQGQVERQLIDQQIKQAQLQTYKAGVGGRLTNADINMLQQGLPPNNASAQYLGQWLGSYSRLLEDKATQDQASAAYVSQNRGDKSPLRAPLQFNGNTYPPGTTYQQVVSHPYGLQGGQTAQAGQSQGSPQGQSVDPNTVVQNAIAAAKNGDAGAQAALAKYKVQY